LRQLCIDAISWAGRFVLPAAVLLFLSGLSGLLVPGDAYDSGFFYFLLGAVLLARKISPTSGVKMNKARLFFVKLRTRAGASGVTTSLTWFTSGGRFEASRTRRLRLE